MKIAYTAPAKGELFPIERKAAVALVRSLCPDLPLLAFQTMHVPKMDPCIPYLATFSSGYIRFLSVKADMMRDDLRILVFERVLPYLCEAVTRHRRLSYTWPAVVIVLEGVIHEVTCSAGGLFPSREEIIKRVKKHPHGICAS
jgi:hypothetical protein